MAGFSKLSEQIKELDNPQRSDVFVRLFRAAVRDGEFDAVYSKERFTLPKQYVRRGAQGGDYQKDSKDMIFELTPAFEAWFSKVNGSLSQNKRAPKKPLPSIDAFSSGSLDFKKFAEETRQKMLASQVKGQKLGRSRKK